MATRPRMAALRSFDCESGVPHERDEGKSGRLFAQDDTLSFCKFCSRSEIAP
jgi:hypothetical protein